MNKALSIVVVLAVVLGGAYWLSTMSKDTYKAPSGTSETTETAENDNVGSQSALNVTVKGPLGLVQSSSGNYISDKQGNTLYVNLKDGYTNNKLVVHCDATCEQTWTPYLVGNDPAPEKSTDSLLSKLNVYKRDDGKYQYSIGISPLYRYAGDRNPGDTNGASVSGWMVAKP